MPMVQKIPNEFRARKKDAAEVWLHIIKKISADPIFCAQRHVRQQ
ncbi:MAG: hypothetical protein ACLPN1_05070 [Dissulfurispiraceae bacterium]